MTILSLKSLFQYLLGCPLLRRIASIQQDSSLRQEGWLPA